jgi:hypothetical protein
MSETIWQAIEKGKKACNDHGFSSIGVYQTNDKNVADGWDRFIISPVHVSEKEYRYVGFVRVDGSHEIERHLTKRATDGATRF